jgi:hypothetical protein
MVWSLCRREAAPSAPISERRTLLSFEDLELFRFRERWAGLSADIRIVLATLSKAKGVWNRCVRPACDPPRIVQHDCSLTRTILTSRTRKAVRTAERAQVNQLVAADKKAVANSASKTIPIANFNVFDFILPPSLGERMDSPVWAAVLHGGIAVECNLDDV